MKDRHTPTGSKNPTIQSMLEHLAEETISPEKLDLCPAVRANLAARETRMQPKEFFMNKRFVFTALATVLVLSVVFIFLANNVTAVSAKEILDRAYQARSQPVPTQGIGHIRSEVYSNFEALPDGQGMDTIVDSYSDFQTGYFRLVTIDHKTSKVLDASAYDGANTYSQDYKAERNANEPLTIYRTPQANVSVKPVGGGNGLDEKAMFEQMRNDPHVVSVSQETWEDGRPVYALKSQQPVKAMINGQAQTPDGLVTIYFDANTYQQLGYRMTMEKDGQEILLASQKILADEILPAGTNVPWDLSDVQGITIVDDPTQTHGDLLPEVVTPKEASQAASVHNETMYLLKNVPEGYTLEITAPPQQPEDQPYIYVAAYRTATNDNFVIQGSYPAELEGLKPSANETYTTASGIVVYFIQDLPSSGKVYVEAIAQAPDGVAFLINSTLPRETIKAWAEELVPVSK